MIRKEVISKTIAQTVDGDFGLIDPHHCSITEKNFNEDGKVDSKGGKKPSNANNNNNRC